MLRTGIIILISTFTVLGGFPRGGDAQLPPAPRWIPPEAVLVLEVEEPAALLDLILAPEVLESVPSLKAYEAFTARPGFKRFLGLVRFLETRLDMDWKTAMRKLTAKGMTLAVLPRNATLLIMDAEDDVVLDKLHKAFLQVMRAGAVLEDRPDRITARKYRGVATWAWKGGGTYAVLGNRLLLTSRPEVLRSVLDVCADPDRGSLATAPAYCAARKAAAPGVAGRVFLDLERVKQNPRVAKALARNRNPIASLLFTGITEALRDSSWLALGVRVKGKTVVLDAAVDGKAVNPAEPTAFGRPPEQGGGALPNLAVPGRIAAVTLYRDLYRFYAAKDTLFPERTSELIFFENMMGIFFSGRDLTEEVLAETKAGIRVVVTEPVFDADIGVPRIKIPAFAVILRLKKPESFGVVAEEAWQKALGLINFTRGQQGQPGLIIDRHFDMPYLEPALGRKEAKGGQNDARRQDQPGAPPDQAMKTRGGCRPRPTHGAFPF